MRFFFRDAILPKDDQLLTDIDRAAVSLYDDLSAVDVGALDISDYSRRYLTAHLSNLRARLQRYSYILAWAVAHTDIPLSEFVLVDYGGGVGILSLLAKRLGVGTVIFDDIYEVSCRDARLISHSVECEADHYVHGDIDELISFARMNSLSCTALASFDVIEHIHDIGAFLTKLPNLSDGSLTLVLTTSANHLNPILRRRIVKKQIEVEHRDREEVWGHKQRDSLKAYLTIRKEIVSQHSPDLPGSIVDQLAKSTRGLVKKDIEARVDQYLKTGRIRPETKHPTNTCDPYTGNWAEHLMSIDLLERTLSDAGFRVEALSGYYSDYDLSRVSAKGLLLYGARFLNPIISVLQAQGLPLAPFYTLYARK